MLRRRIALGLEYDGSQLEGWQTQPHGRTVQDLLERALEAFAEESIATICAGRTDAGVHACGQVAHFDTLCQREEFSWVRGVNRYLPAQIAVRWARYVDADFHARYSARARHYEYWIWNHPVRSPLLERRTGWVFRALNVPAMQSAAAQLLGTHDFSSFRSAQCQSASAVRTLVRCDVQQIDAQLICVRVSANAFLHHMVRNVVGALVAVGTGRHDAEWIAKVLAARDRTQAASTIEAAGLYLMGIEYDANCGVPKPEDRVLFR
ncbi:MAG TPA: tRNA pseudouridine(38-40) synthase TruA [Burkholderiaceae bacterium]|nr:tRNA pseudouridine(38-40) synthase TruA [Burkholderiaceae bacterium]